MFRDAVDRFVPSRPSKMKWRQKMIGRRRIGRVDSIRLCTEHRLGTKKHAEHIDGRNMYNEHASQLVIMAAVYGPH